MNVCGLHVCCLFQIFTFNFIVRSVILTDSAGLLYYCVNFAMITFFQCVVCICFFIIVHLKIAVSGKHIYALLNDEKSTHYLMMKRVPFIKLKLILLVKSDLKC